MPSPEELARKNLDAYLIGLTDTPSKQTIGFFNKNLVDAGQHQSHDPRFTLRFPNSADQTFFNWSMLRFDPYQPKGIYE